MPPPSLPPCLPPRLPQSCRNAATVVMWDSNSNPHPVKPHIMMREDGEAVIHIVNVEASSFERGLDERRLQLTIDAQGTVLKVGQGGKEAASWTPQAAHLELTAALPCAPPPAVGVTFFSGAALGVWGGVIAVIGVWGRFKAALEVNMPRVCVCVQVGDSPMSLFGLKPSSLVGQPLARFIDVFQALQEETPQLVRACVAACMYVRVCVGGGGGQASHVRVLSFCLSHE